MRHAPAIFTAWHVLAAEITATGAVTRTNADWAAGSRAILPVIRIDARITGPDPALQATIISILSRLPAQSSLELDYDAPTARLPEYATFLHALRHRLAPGTAILITALPTWLQSPAFPSVARSADLLILQLHAIDDPRLALFDAARAARWTASLASRSNRPFLISLPAYGARTVAAADGTLLAVSAEAPALGGGSGTEITANPSDLAGFLATLRRNPPALLRGIVWFRLPMPADRRAWSMETLRRVAAAEPLAPRITVQTRTGPAPGLSLIVVTNDSESDGMLPAALDLAEGCALADGAGNYTLSGNRLVQRGRALLRAHTEIRAGWQRCGEGNIPIAEN